MKYLFFVLVGLFPFVSSAATYLYVNNQAVVDDVEAVNPTIALADAPNIAVNSGVAIDGGDIEVGAKVPVAVVVSGSEGTYVYVNSQGVTSSIVASSAELALGLAPNIATNSGVAIDGGDIAMGEKVSAAE